MAWQRMCSGATVGAPAPFSLRRYNVHMGMHGLLFGVASGMIRPKVPMQAELPHPDVGPLIDRCLSYKPQERPTFSGVLAELQRIANQMRL